MNHNLSQPTGRTIARSAYHAVVPKLSRLRQEVFDVLQQYGPQTANEVVNKLPPSGLSNNNVRSRLAELVGLGLVAINRVVSDPISGHRARQYRAVEPGEQPPASAEVARPRRKSRGQLLAENARLAAENEALKSKLDAVLEDEDRDDAAESEK